MWVLSTPFQPWFGCRGVNEGKASGRGIDSLHVDLVCWGAAGMGDPAWHDLEVSCLWKVPLLGRGLLILARPLELPLLNVVLELFFLNQAEIDILGGLLEMCPWILGVQGLLHCRMRELGMDFFDPFLHVFLRDSMFEQEFLERLVIGVEFGSSEDNTRARRYMQSGDGRSLPDCIDEVSEVWLHPEGCALGTDLVGDPCDRRGLVLWQVGNDSCEQLALVNWHFCQVTPVSEDLPATEVWLGDDRGCVVEGLGSRMGHDCAELS